MRGGAACPAPEADAQQHHAGAGSWETGLCGCLWRRSRVPGGPGSGLGAGPRGGLEVASCGVRRPCCRGAKGPGKPRSDSQVGRHRLSSVRSPDGEEEDQAGSRRRPWTQSSHRNPASVSTCVTIKPTWGQECKAGLTFYTVLEQCSTLTTYKADLSVVQGVLRLQEGRPSAVKMSVVPRAVCG